MRIFLTPDSCPQTLYFLDKCNALGNSAYDIFEQRTDAENDFFQKLLLAETESHCFSSLSLKLILRIKVIISKENTKNLQIQRHIKQQLIRFYLYKGKILTNKNICAIMRI